jgi:hypothetical protein
MSRGFGTWQRLIISTVHRCDATYLHDLLPVRFTRAQYTALLRAAYTLEDRGLISIRWYP